MLIDIRIPPKFTPAQIFNEIRIKIKQYQDANPKVTVKLAIEDSNEPFEA